jgi:WhiB family redox-sensing transcriptional regulator
MALSSQITRAVMPDKPPVGKQAIDGYGIAEFILPTEDDERRQLAIGLCSVAIRHRCDAGEPEQGDPCTNRNHARDAEAARKALILAGLAPDPYPSVDRERKIAPGPPKPTAEFTRAQRQREQAAAEGHILRPDWSWQDDGACRGEDPELFIAPDGERQAEREVREKKAKAICDGCTVRSACLDAAIKWRAVGVWGGLGDDERAAERRRRMRRANAA